MNAARDLSPDANAATPKSAATEEVLSTEAEVILGRVVGGLNLRLSKVTDDLYAGLLEDVQEHLIDNARFNIGQKLEAVERGRRETFRIALQHQKDAERYRQALRRLSALTPGAANAASAQDLHLTVRAIAETALSNTLAPAGSDHEERHDDR